MRRCSNFRGTIRFRTWRRASRFRLEGVHPVECRKQRRVASKGDRMKARSIWMAVIVLLASRPATTFQAPIPPTAPAKPPAGTIEFDDSRSEMRSLIEGFTSDRGNLLRTYNVEGPTQRNRLKKFYSEWMTRLTGLQFDSMSQDSKVDYVLLRRYLDHELQRLDFDAKEQSEISQYVPFAEAVLAL